MELDSQESESVGHGGDWQVAKGGPRKAQVGVDCKGCLSLALSPFMIIMIETENLSVNVFFPDGYTLFSPDGSVTHLVL